ncbi:outer membrane beta-barrel protein [Luteimonas sp. A537]
MNTTKIFAGTVLAAALGAASFGAAHAAEPVGWYAGAGVGQSMIDEGWLDEEETGFQAFGGYQMHPNWGVELGYTDFGDIDISGVASLEADTVSLVAVGTLPFTEKFSGYAKGGFHSWDADLRAPGIGRASDDGTDPTYGLGLQYRFTDTFALRGEYSRFEMDDADVDLAQVQVRFDF